MRFDEAGKDLQIAVEKITMQFDLVSGARASDGEMVLLPAGVVLYDRETPDCLRSKHSRELFGGICTMRSGCIEDHDPIVAQTVELVE